VRKSLLVLGLSSLVAVVLAAPAPARAMSTYYVDKSCSACHGATPTTCNGCHHHGGSPSISGAQPTYQPGATISITVNGGSQSGWVRGAILDANNAILATTTKTAYPVTVTATAPTTPGTYTWKGAWYGNGYDSGGVIGGGSATFVRDPNNANHGFEPRPFTFTVAAPPPVTCTSFTYTAFAPATCPSTGVQTRTVLTSSPAGCTGGSPVLSQTCTPPPPAPVTCTAFTYSTWGTCSASGTQTRTVLSSSPAGCTGGSPVLTQACTPAPVACTYTTGAWGACQANGTQTRTVTASPAGCTGTPPASSQSCTYVPPVVTCTSFTYTAFAPATCPSTGVQTRTVLTSSPAGCTGGTPVLSQSCTPPPPTTAACGTCHGIPPSSGKHSTHASRSCSTCHGTGYSNTTVNAATHQNGTVNIATTIGWNATTRSCSNSCHGTHSWGAAGTVTLPPPPPTTTTDGAALYTANCAGCHGALASSTKKGRTAAQIQAAINANTGGMGSLSSLTSTQVQAIATALAGTTTPPPTSTDGASLYAANCQSCHGALASSEVRGRSATQIRSAISSNTGGMGTLSSLTSTQISAIATVLADTGGTPTTSCTSCHAAPPDTGRHLKHVNEQRISCARCHGTGYDVAAKTVNTTTHQDGRVQLRSSLNWSSSNRSCAPGCHGTEKWSSSTSSDAGHDGSSGDDIVVVDDGSAAPHAGGCASTGGAFTVMVFAGLAAAILRRRRSRA
jgi:uncharacterized protein (TIGR03382 family)